MPSEYLEIEVAIANLRADMTVLESGIQALKERDIELFSSLSKANTSLMDMKLAINDRFNVVNNEVSNLDGMVIRMQKELDNISASIVDLETKMGDKIECLDSKLDKVSNNSLLEFTSEFDLKKSVGLILLLLSLLTSPGIVTSWLTGGSQVSDQKIDTLIELLQEQ